VKPCPTCGAVCRDDDTFCEADGTKLGAPPALEAENHETTVDTAPTSVAAVAPPSSSSPLPCGACGSNDADDGDGYCRLCGHRLDQSPGRRAALEETTASSLRPGASVGRYLIHSPAATDDARATAADGTEVLLVVGEPATIAAEAEALEQLAKERSFPGVLDRGEARPLAFLALSPPDASARKLIDVVQNESATEAVKVIRALLDVAEMVEGKGFTFQPASRDLLLAPDGTVQLCRLRSARRTGRPFDAGRFLECLGEIFLPPALLGPTRLVRLLVPNRESADEGDRSISEIRSALAAVEADIAEPTTSFHVAELCDPGLWRPYNQDSTAIANDLTSSGEPFTVLVVCDGVSSSSFSQMASSIASRAARDALTHFARSPDIKHETTASAVAQAIRAAHLAICAAHVAEPVSDLPGTTIAAGLIYRRRLTIGWVGDSRCYWLTPRGAELLTHDHSWVNEAIARGEVKDATEVQGALAHTITKCLGPLEVGDVPAEIEPDVRSRDLAGPGLVLLCTDGLWNYAPEPEDIARVMRVAPDETNAVGMARLFINYALARGGQDNVSVALYAHA
jgi:PPM family protein phosphatase